MFAKIRNLGIDRVATMCSKSRVRLVQLFACVAEKSRTGSTRDSVTRLRQCFEQAMPLTNRLYRNRKTGTLYVKLYDAHDCNAQSQALVIVYSPWKDGEVQNLVFVRSAKEFQFRFELLGCEEVEALVKGASDVL